MAGVTSIDKNEGHGNTINNSEIIPLNPCHAQALALSDDKKRYLDITIREVKRKFRNWLIKRKELITTLGNAFEAVISNPEDVCEEIKNILQEEITDKIISARDIERYCPDKWKKKTTPKNDNLSFSKQQQTQTLRHEMVNRSS